MSGSETGVMATRGDPFPVNLQKSSNPLSSVQNMRLAFSPDGAAIYQPIRANSPSYQPPATAGNGGMDGSSGGGVMGLGMPPQGINMNMSVEPLKKKRGRPRKYGPDSAISLALSPATPLSSVAATCMGFSPPHNMGGSGSADVLGGNSIAADGSAGGSLNSSVRKARGRPRGSKNKKKSFDVLGSAGLGFTPHVITVKAGEDVCSKIMSFSQHVPRAVCILSANGAISSVMLRQPAISGGTVTYEGRFEILSLSGSFLLSENGSQRSRTGGLSVSLSGPDGRVLGGGVAGLLTAASPVQVIVGSFVAESRDEPKAVNPTEPFLGSKKLPLAGVGGSSPSHGTPSESSEGGGSPLNQGLGGACNNSAPQVIPAMLWK
ncbi:hypothetical protein MLD38_022152 [Melastoma candidum]|uniref:Uncharacterized protein n=1 Tax=Melastoma candidum TaxID=119954 RepID=A0ACB9QHK5_9MYRT|nr:hypothetical protein MLD38_022152 [Melastoma candidum]